MRLSTHKCEINLVFRLYTWCSPQIRWFSSDIARSINLLTYLLQCSVFIKSNRLNRIARLF